MFSNLFLPKVTILYAGLMGLLYTAFTIYVIRMRGQAKIGMGHDNDPASELFRAIRIHGSFSEYIPFILLLMALDEMSGEHAGLLHFIGFSLLIGRISTYLGFKKSHTKSPERMIGIILTALPMIYFSVMLVWKGLK